MALIYQGFLTDSDGSNPHSFRYGVPTGGSGVKCEGWSAMSVRPTLVQVGVDLTEHYASYPDRVPPTLDADCTVIFEYLTHDPSATMFDISCSAYLNRGCGNSAFVVAKGQTKVFWFCKSTAQIGLNTTRNILFSRPSNSDTITAAFRLGSNVQFTCTCPSYGTVWLAPWIYPNIRYNSSITGCAGGCGLFFEVIDDSTPPRLKLPVGYSIPSYKDASWSSTMDTWLNGLPEPVDVDNPYFDGGISEPGGGDGNFSEDSDAVEEDAMPSLDAVGTGMATIFSPSKSQLKSLSEVFWGSQWWTALQNTIEGIDKMFVSLGIVPFSVTKGSTVEVTWLGLSITEVMLTLASQQFYEFDMGTIDLSNDSRIFTSGSALDYSPFSRLGIYLPFIGFQDLDIDECRGTTINLKYRIDILSGTCVALIKIGGKTIYQFTGNCITQIPITSQNFENMFTNAVNVGIALGTARNAAAVASAGEAVSSEMVQQGKMSATAAALDATQRSARVSAANASLGNATANAMMGMKPDFNKTGSVSASASLLTVKQPFLYLKTPRQCLPDHYQRYCGFPSNMTGKLSSFSGYTVVEDIRLNGLVATNGEVEEIYDLLKSGVII